MTPVSTGELIILSRMRFAWIRQPVLRIFMRARWHSGIFSGLLSDYPADTLHETIPDFHNTPDRFRKFRAAVEADVCGRAAAVQDEIRFVRSGRRLPIRLMDRLAEGKLPLRVTHNDTKLNNIMLDEKTRKGICVIDLDTVMPGLSVNDFGDSIRFGASTGAEDEPDLTKISCDLDLFEAYTKGFIEGCCGSPDRRRVESACEWCKDDDAGMRHPLPDGFIWRGIITSRSTETDRIWTVAVPSSSW